MKNDLSSLYAPSPLSWIIFTTLGRNPYLLFLISIVPSLAFVYQFSINRHLVILFLTISIISYYTFYFGINFDSSITQTFSIYLMFFYLMLYPHYSYRSINTVFLYSNLKFYSYSFMSSLWMIHHHISWFILTFMMFQFKPWMLADFECVSLWFIQLTFSKTYSNTN